MYDEFDGDWRDIFMAKPYQGQDPEKASILFVGRDANYPEDLCDHPFFERIKEYHRDGVAFWEKHEVHHPFLCDDFPFPRNKGGVPYHKTFSRIGLNKKYAQYVSFIELREVATIGVTGVIPSADFIKLLNLPHMQRLERWILHSGRKHVFLPKTIRENMLQWRNYMIHMIRKKEISEPEKAIPFEFLNCNTPTHRDENGLPVIYSGGEVLILQTYSFSSTEINAIIPKIKPAIDRFLSGNEAPPMVNRNPPSAKNLTEDNAMDEFLAFCEAIVGKTGWFPRKTTSVTVERHGIESNGVRPQIVRSGVPDPTRQLLRREDVNTGIRVFRKLGRVGNIGDLRRAGIANWPCSPLLALLELYFEQVGFSR